MYGVMDDYEYNATHKRRRILVWSGPFYSVFEADGYSLPRRDGYMLTTYNGDKIRVACPIRSDETWQETDKAIDAALTAHYAERK
jgi:hypothetical protein